MPRAPRTDDAGLWFQGRPRRTLAVAAALYLAIFVLRQVVEGAAEAVCLLYVLPIALVAFAFGRTAGALAGALGFVLFAVWALVDDVEFGAVGWLARALPMLLLGVLVGGAAEHQRQAAAAERELLLAQLRARRAAELNDSLVQRLAAAKWAAEAGKHERSLDLLTETVGAAQLHVSALLDSRSAESDGPSA